LVNLWLLLVNVTDEIGYRNVTDERSVELFCDDKIFRIYINVFAMHEHLNEHVIESAALMLIISENYRFKVFFPLLSTSP